MRLLWRGVQAEQVSAGPAERLGLLAPYREKLAAVRHALPPAGDVDQGRRLELEVGECPPIAPRLRQLNDLDPAACAIRLCRDAQIGRARVGGFGPRPGLGALLMD